jgi:ubiquinone/menaquinone biosynthesis C-methylase UbiE
MNFYDRYILPPLINCTCGMKVVGDARAEIVPQAQGDVLELGIGSGFNLPLYDQRRVRRLTAVDPSEPMLAYARRKLAIAPFPVDLIASAAEDITLPDRSIDTVVVTFTLCSIPDAQAALTAARRVLRPGGRLLFLEHGLAPDEGVRRWQRRVTPLWRRLAGGCHLDRDVPALLGRAGFSIQDLVSRYLPDTPRLVGFTYRGSAVPV